MFHTSRRFTSLPDKLFHADIETSSEVCPYLSTHGRRDVTRSQTQGRSLLVGQQTPRFVYPRTSHPKMSQNRAVMQAYVDLISDQRWMPRRFSNLRTVWRRGDKFPSTITSSMVDNLASQWAGGGLQGVTLVQLACYFNVPEGAGKNGYDRHSSYVIRISWNHCSIFLPTYQTSLIPPDCQAT